MSEDIVADLQRSAEVDEAENGPSEWVEISRRGAAEIERLRAEIERLRADVAWYAAIAAME